MAKITTKIVDKIAKLSNLSLTEKERVEFAKQLSSVVDYFDSLNEADVKGVDSTSQTTGLTNIYKKDKIDISHSLTQEQALSGTDNTKNGYFVTDLILDKTK